ncbi:MAG: lipopolysaccharide heptosyltransferase II [Candidatus Cloacimonetes bacterium]|nr:lipopolysaccharide heptosyltransferase II [Candidatus Cloacimonadota bacterium]
MRILVVHTAFIGDVILITPLIKHLKLLFPDYFIDILVIPQTASILKNNPNIENILIFDKKKNKLKSFFSTLLNLRKNKYDLCFLPHSSFTTALLVFLAGIKIRIGFDRWLAAKFLIIKIPFSGKHRIEKNLNLLNVYDNKKRELQTELFPSKSDIKKSEKLLSKLDNGKVKIAMAPGSVWKTKCWSEENYKSLAEELVEDGFSVILIGSPAEKELCGRILPDKNAINLAGETTILESAAILKKCDLLVCNDSGSLHLANGMKTDVFAIFGPTVQDIGYYPFRENDYVFETKLECRPCGSHGAMECPLKHHLCMKNITPEMVLEKIISHGLTRTKK